MQASIRSMVTSIASSLVGKDSSLNYLDRVVKHHAQPPVPGCHLDDLELGGLGNRIVLGSTSSQVSSEIAKELGEGFAGERHGTGFSYSGVDQASCGGA
jgi:hypothetical protein